MHDFKTKKEKPVALPTSTLNLELDDFYTAKALSAFPKTKCNSSILRRQELAHQATKAYVQQSSSIKLKNSPVHLAFKIYKFCLKTLLSMTLHSSRKMKNFLIEKGFYSLDEYLNHWPNMYHKLATMAQVFCKRVQNSTESCGVRFKLEVFELYCEKCF